VHDEGARRRLLSFRAVAALQGATYNRPKMDLAHPLPGHWRVLGIIIATGMRNALELQGDNPCGLR
jgi:hypothetical protein